MPDVDSEVLVVAAVFAAIGIFWLWLRALVDEACRSSPVERDLTTRSNLIDGDL